MAENDASYAADSRHDPRLLSPPRAPPANFGKERRQPSITPRKFQKFFTPRQSSRVSSRPSAARRALRELTAGALNRSQTPSSPLKPVSLSHGLVCDSDLQTPPQVKRRKLGHTPESSPLKPSAHPLDQTPIAPPRFNAESALLSPIDSLHSPVLSQELSDDEDEVADMDMADLTRSLGKITPLKQRGFAGQLVQRQLGGMPYAGEQFLSKPVIDWRVETADFCSTKDDVHVCSSHEGSATCIPFCVATCNTNSMIAIGDEEGHVRLLDSMSAGNGVSKQFRDPYVGFQTHGNAIIDLDFSTDDSLLATASGDQTGKVIDMMTQTPISILGHHSASLKQIRFQPGNGQGSVLATSSRDGSVQIWDLRCKGPPVEEFGAHGRKPSLGFRLPRKITQGCVVNSLYNAHARTMRQSKSQNQATSADVAGRFEVAGRLGEVSVTALQFLPAGREHLLLSACEADASIKLWDIRNIHSSRHKTASPVSFTTPPVSHTQWRPYGISSMSLSTDGARLYTACKDNTVYAYSTAHLVLGHAPELTSRGEPPRRRHGAGQEGLGPIYGFRHDKFRAASFYIKSAIRPARGGQSELLAVGSSDACAVLFPTDERYLRQRFSSMGSEGQLPSHESTIFSSTAPRRPGLFRTNSATNLSARPTDTIPIVRNFGTALVRGHSKEVGALSWTNEGRLITVGDDYAIRRWSEDKMRASDLRTGGEGSGRRWASGWADVGDEWDLDGDDEW